VLGTDGFGRSDFRAKLREHFEVDRRFVVLAALRALADEGKVDRSAATEAIVRYGINPAKVNPHSA
jgi:pyruvate dehydrogenase E1 component